MWREQDFAQFETDKFTKHDYLPLYSRHLYGIRERALRIIEFGVQNGASLRLWQAMFPNAKLVGVDISAACASLADDRTEIVIGSQADPATVDAALGVYGGADVIIDDAGHMSREQVACFERAFPGLAAGGVYVVEDLETSYWQEYTAGCRITMLDYLKNLVDAINVSASLVRNPLARDIAFLDFATDICAVVKR